MKDYLFLYPVEEYMEFFADGYGGSESINYLQEIINSRYRKGDYGINWLVFKDQDGEPDIGQIYDEIDIRDEDKILKADITFADIKDENYADEGHVLSQLSEPEKLVIGGFHLNSCVERMGRYALRSGIKTFIDLETTDLFFPGNRSTNIPLVREEWPMEEFVPQDGINRLDETSKRLRFDPDWDI